MVKFKKIVEDPSIIIRALNKVGLLNWISDTNYVKWRYRIQHNQSLDLENPKTFNEKLQWLKLNYHNPEYVPLVDKIQVREHISNLVGDEYLIPLIGVWENANDIDWDLMPDKFVLKCSHDSGSVIVCTDKSTFDKKAAITTLNKALGRNYYYAGREWPYKFVKPKVMAEKFLETSEKDELRDYRFFCFEGEPKFISVDTNINNKSKTRRNLYDLNWNLLDAEITYKKDLNNSLDKPNKLDEMIEISKKLSESLPHVRIDLYNIDDEIYFGEYTFYHQSGLGIIRPNEFDLKLGSWINLAPYRENIKKK